MDKNEVIQAINAQAEVESLLGPPKNNKYRCYNREAHSNGDKNPSLTISQDGYYKCHACGVAGDIIQLYMDVNNIPKSRFNEAIKELARKWNVYQPTEVKLTKREAKVAKERKTIPKREARKQIRAGINDINNSKYNKGVREWLLEHYGINATTISERMIGWSSYSNRLLIPIPAGSIRDDNDKLAPIVNIRKHDVLRYHCDWVKDDMVSKKRPAEVTRENGEWIMSGWSTGTYKMGKVHGVRGHNSAYIFPMDQLMSDGMIYLVGGELKALLLIQYGYKAVSFTSGESNYPRDMLQFFADRDVRILYDIDESGINGAKKIGQAIANAGAKSVKYGVMEDERLPSNGDITDYLRINEWNVECMNAISWVPIERDPNTHGGISFKEAPKAYKTIKFEQLTSGEFLNKFVTVPVLVSGKDSTKYAVPSHYAAQCKAGKASQNAKCRTCSLAAAGFETAGFPKTRFPIKEEHVVDMTGAPKGKIKEIFKSKIGITKGCNKAEIQIDYAAVERAVVVPTIDINSDEFSEYRHQSIYVVAGSPKENVAHRVSGQIVGDPRNNSFTLAATKFHPLDGDVFSYRHENSTHEELRNVIWNNKSSVAEAMVGIVKDLSENILYKFGVDQMILVEVLSFMMPFGFSIGKHYCHKVCPEVMILGDTRVGKSTTARDLAKHFGAGRYVDCGSNTTFVGLVGGNAEFGGSKSFTWGVIPTSNRGHLSLDEYNKLDFRTIGGLTNIKSSGVAERTTNSGARKTAANVRFLTMCNPRHRKLTSYESPLDAAIEVVGTPQDLARVDLLYVAYGVKDQSVLNTNRDSVVEHRYTRELARYHMKWAWSLVAGRIRFLAPSYVLDRSADLIKKLKGINLIAPAEAKFKLGRLAVAIATMVYSFDYETKGVIVNNEHVDIAYALLDELYSSYMENAGVKTGILPDAIVQLLDSVPDDRVLYIRILSTSTTWTEYDFKEVFGEAKVGKFKYMAQLEYGLMTRGRGHFIPEENVRELIHEYIKNRLERTKQ